MLETRRALQWLEALQLRAGDVVVESRRSDLRNDDELDPKRLRLVASITDDGTVYFQGGGATVPASTASNWSTGPTMSPMMRRRHAATPRPRRGVTQT